MSWQEYVDTSLVGSGYFSQAAIIGLDGGVWAVSPSLNISQQEAAKLVQAYSMKGAQLSEGLLIGGQKFIYVRGDERSIFLRSGPLSVTIVKTQQCLLLGVTDTNSGTSVGNASKTIEELADYLLSVGY